MNKYGVGSCGPRGFYGTIDVHLELEVCLKGPQGLTANRCRESDTGAVCALPASSPNTKR